MENQPASLTPYVHRPNEYERIVSYLLDQRFFLPVALTTSLPGGQGFGKTTLAKRICHDPRLRNAFSEIAWVTLGSRLTQLELFSKIEALIFDLTGERPVLENLLEAEKILHEILESRRLLLVIDEADDPQAVEAFLHAGPGGACLLITHDDARLPVSARRVPVDIMMPGEGRDLLLSGLHSIASIPEGLPLPPPETSHPSETPGEEFQMLEHLADRLNEWPLLLALFNGLLRVRYESRDSGGETLKDLLHYAHAALDRQGLDTGWRVDDATARKRALDGIVDACLEFLTEGDRRRFFDLAVFPPGENIPFHALQTLWEISAEDTRGLCEQLSRRALISVDAEKGAIRIHAALNACLRDQFWTDQIVQLHNRLVEAYRVQCPKGWASGPDDGYFFQHLAYHLEAAERQDGLRALLFDYDWIANFLSCAGSPEGRANDIYALMADYDRALSTALDRQSAELRLVQDALRLSAPVLARDPSQLAPQLLGRLLPFNEPEIRAMIQEAQKWQERPWMRPLAGCFVPPGGEEIRVLQGHTDWVSGVDILPDGQHAVSASLDGTLRVWDLSNGLMVRSVKGHDSGISAVKVSSDGLRVVSAGFDGRLSIWNPATWDSERIIAAHHEPIGALVLTRDGKYAFTGADDRLIRMWDLETGEMRTELIGHGDLVRALALSPDDRTLVSGSWDKTLRLWDVETGNLLHILTGHEGWVRSVGFTPDGYYAISGAWDRAVRLWDLWTGETVRMTGGFGTSIFSLCVTPDDQLILAGGGDGSIYLLDVVTMAATRSLNGHAGGVNDLVVTPGGRFVISASDDQTLRVWDLVAMREGVIQPGHDGTIPTLATLPDGKRVLSGSADGSLKVWDSSSGEEISRLEGHTGEIICLDVSADGRRALSGSRDCTVRLWDLAAGQAIRSLAGHTRPVTAVALNPDARVAVSGDDGGAICAWDLETGELLAQFRGEGAISAVVLSPDGCTITASETSGKMYFLEISR